MHLKSFVLIRSILFISLVFATLLMAARAFTPPPNNPDYMQGDEFVFLADEVTVVEITLNPSDFTDLLNDPHSDELKTASMRWKNSRIDETLANVGFRVRGGVFTRGATRKSWKIDVKAFSPGREFYGLEEIDLNGDHNDETMLRRHLAHEFLHRMGLRTQL